MTRDYILTVENLSMAFGGLVALDRVNLQVHRNAITALIGPNGAGKTTVFNCLTGFYLPSAGRLAFTPQSGMSIDLMLLLGSGWQWQDFCSPLHLSYRCYYKLFGGTHQIVRHGITRTFQNTRLFMGMTAMENLLVAQHRAMSPLPLSGIVRLPAYLRAERSAVQLAYSYLDEFGLGQVANRVAKELPYGQQKKLEIIRALCTKPQLLCLDEPAAGLNSAETAELATMIRSIKNKHGITVFIIEHDMSLVMHISDQVIVLDSGAVIATGTPAQISKNAKVLEAYLGSDYQQHQASLCLL